MCSAITSARSLRSTPRTERPSDCMVSRRHSASRSTSPPSRQWSTNACAARDMWPPKQRTFCLVKTDCSERLRGRHCSLGRTKRLSPAACWTSSWTTHRSEKASLRPSTSRMPSGEKTATSGGNSHFGPHCMRVIGPPASRTTSCPLSRFLTAFTNCRSGSGFLGANGNAPTSVVAADAMTAPGGRRRAGGSTMWLLQSRDCRPACIAQRYVAGVSANTG
jgi:hypothetical protein